MSRVKFKEYRIILRYLNMTNMAWLWELYIQGLVQWFLAGYNAFMRVAHVFWNLINREPLRYIKGYFIEKIKIISGRRALLTGPPAQTPLYRHDYFLFFLFFLLSYQYIKPYHCIYKVAVLACDWHKSFGSLVPLVAGKPYFPLSAWYTGGHDIQLCPYIQPSWYTAMPLYTG